MYFKEAPHNFFSSKNRKAQVLKYRQIPPGLLGQTSSHISYQTLSNMRYFARTLAPLIDELTLRLTRGRNLVLTGTQVYLVDYCNYFENYAVHRPKESAHDEDDYSDSDTG